jgi:hypothetical protein
MLVLGFAASFAQAANHQFLRGHIPEQARSLIPTGQLDPTNRLNLAISLPLRNRESLARLLTQIYDPASTNYHRYLTPEQFAGAFGPTEQDYETVIAFATTNGFTVTQRHSNRTLLNVSAPVADIQKTLHTALNVYQHPTEARSFYAPASDPSLDLPAAVLDISGLDNYVLPHSKNLRPEPLNQSANSTPKNGSGQSGSYFGNDFRAAYVPGVTLTGSGESVGLLEFDGYYASDITTYEAQAGLQSVPLQNVLLDGFSGTPTKGKNSGSSEVSLDIEMAIAMAPGLSKVILYEAGPNGSALDILDRMATDNLAGQLSCSWDFGSTSTSTMDQIFQQFAAQGQSFFNASGDSGAYVGSIPAPDDDPYITIVGGTTLTTRGPGGAWVSETVWNWNSTGLGSGASSGGISTTYAIPAWQQGIDMSRNQGSTTMRNVPDVALTSDNIWVTYNNGSSGTFGGTSCAAPLWAAFTALINEQALSSGGTRVGFINPALYWIGRSSAYQAAFHDITTGNNFPDSSASQFTAAPGYDLCTGLGTPVGQALINALVGPQDPLRISPGTHFTATGPVGGPFSVAAQEFSLTNAGATPLNWVLVNTAPWLTVSLVAGVLSQAAPGATLTVSLNSVAANLPAGVYSANIVFSNLTSQSAQSRAFTLQVGQNLVQNGGFETSDFSDWTLSGTAADNHVAGQSGGRPHPELVHSGLYGALLGEVGAVAYLSQTLPTTDGQTYLLSFWVDSPYFSSTDTPNEFQVAWVTGNSTANILFDQSNMAPFNWTNFQFLVMASGQSSALQFGARNDPQEFGLDDVSVTPLPQLTLRATNQADGSIQLTWNTVPGLTYRVQYTTDLTQASWVSVGAPTTGTGSTATTSDISPPDLQRFYRLVLLP